MISVCCHETPFISILCVPSSMLGHGALKNSLIQCVGERGQGVQIRTKNCISVNEATVMRSKGKEPEQLEHGWRHWTR